MKKYIGALSISSLLVSLVAFAPSSNATLSTVTYWGATATATTEYSSGWRADLAIGAPDAEVCDDEPEQAWTYGEPWVDSQLVVELDQPTAGTELAVYFSYDLVDNLRIELAFEGLEGFYLFSDITDDLTCSDNADTEYPNDIKVTRPLDGISKVTAIRFTVMTELDYPEIDAVGVVSNLPLKPTKTKNPTITGTNKVGKILVANAFPNSWTANPSPSFKYQWFECTKAGTNSPSTKPADCSAIKNAEEAGYKLKAAQKGNFIRVRVTAKNSAGSTTVFSKTTAKIS